MTSGSLNKAVHVHTYVRPRYCRLLAVLIGIIVLVHFLFVPFSPSLADTPYLSKVDFGKSLRSRGVGAQVPLDGNGWKKIGDWCTEEEYLDGEWVKREEEVTMENIRRVFHYTDRGVLKCQARETGYGDDPKEDDPRMSERILETAQFEYRPKSGCRRHAWNRWNFSKFCLRSRAGCSLVGDSLADQIYMTIQHSMISGFGPKGAPDSLFHLSATPESQYIIKVNKNHPDAPALALAAGVEMSRLDRPVFTFHREHHLVSRPELDKALGRSPGYVPFVGGPSFAEQRFVWDRSWWYEKWTNLLRHAVQFLPEKDGRKPVKEENSVIALSMGPHWSPRELWPENFKQKPDTYDFVVRGFQGAFDTILHNVTQVAKTHKVTAWWRSNSPGHYECWQYDKPENDRTDQLSTRDSSLQVHNWMHYPKMDKYVASHLGYKPSDSNHYLRPTSYAMRYLDFWTMSIKRPDAHLKPAIDCLHFCQPGVAHEWLRFWWHMILIQAENGDYDDEPVGDSWIAKGMPT
ncbi:hypothetical protein QFC20_003324 [Naganishia adeliensis]|uniref:Uncharacterized protein n=1 Tax=Naganishia adeliensis TaxID=92952 RepID=A0ACC2WCN6_9TREE|nr:hypothetical protein QFC20_003324 [Naganishia adeliensis]